MSSRESGLTRRGFLGLAGAAGVGSLLLGRGARAEAPAGGTGAIPRRRFGRSGIDLPVLSLGASMDTTQNRLLLKQCLKLGVMYWDTAPNYSQGKSEEGLGQFFAKNQDERKNVFLVTKTGPGSVERLEKALNGSLEKMKTDYADLYMFHGVASLDGIDREEVKAWAEKAKKAGKIRFVGLSTHKRMAAVMTEAARLGWLDAVMTSINYRIMRDDDMKAAVDECVKADMGITAMKTQGGGPINDTKADRDLAGHFIGKGYTPEQAKVKAVLADERITTLCSHMDTVEVLKSNVAAVCDRTSLDAADWKVLDRHAAATCSSFCAACGGCERITRAPVPEIMRYLMYARGYGDHAGAQALFRALPAASRKRLASVDFSRAEKACRQGLPIGRLMKEAVLELA